MAGNDQKKTKSRMVKAKDREKQVLELRRAGFSYEVIGKQVGMSRAGAYKCVKRHMDKIDNECTDLADDVRQLELQRLDEITSTIWPYVIQGQTQYIDRILKVMDRRAKYLGIDAPEKQEVRQEVIEDGSALSELARRLDKYAQSNGES
jgi:hypothetical protein|tara:strand:+ start:366 stop:812 length:447 start_codon:yes stop_codon:yes gene_type:complete